jgi:hypothetical protein
VLKLALPLVLQLTLQLALPHLPLDLQLRKIIDLIQGKHVPSLGDLLSGFSKYSTSLKMGETRDLPTNGYTVTKETSSETMLKFWYAHLTIDMSHHCHPTIGIHIFHPRSH